MITAREKLQAWVEKNPEGYLTMKIVEIAAQAGVSAGTVSKELYAILADREGCLPSDILKKRQQAGFRSYKRKLSKHQKTTIQKLHREGREIIDIAYLANTSIHNVRKFLDI